MQRFCIAIFLAGWTLLAASAEPPTRARVVTTFFPIYCWTATVAGETLTVENLLSARAEPHDYAFTLGDARKLNTAELIIANGLGLETWLPRFLRSSPTVSKRLVNVSAGLGTELIGGHSHEEHGHDHDHTSDNPHIWLDPLLAMHGVSNICAALQRIAPEHASVFATNAQAYLRVLKNLDEEIRATLAPLTNRVIITYHDAFAYFARRYALEIAGVVEEVPEVNPTPKYVADLGRTIRSRSIRHIFIAPGSESRLARRIAKDFNVTLVRLDTLETGTLTPDAYEKAMRGVAATLAAHLK